MERAARVRSHSDDLIAAMDRSVQTMAAASADLLRDIARFDELGLWTHEGATSMTGWLAARYGVARSTAREWVRVSRALPDLPAIERAYRGARLSWDQLRPVTRFATAETDAHWARTAPRLRPWTLYREAERHEEARRRDADEAHRNRGLHLWWDAEVPVLHLEGMLPSEQGEALQQALEKRAERVVLVGEPVSRQEARMADALVELVTRTEGGEPQPSMLVVHAEASVLAGAGPSRGPVLAETESGHRLASDAIRRLACDGRIEWVLEEGTRVVGIGRRGRVVPGQIARLLRHRDRGCRFPGCERRRWVHAHHLTHWADGGGTDLDNLVLLCHAHHRLLHEGGWRTSGHPGGGLRFHDPRGRPIRDGPGPPVRPGSEVA